MEKHWALAVQVAEARLTGWQSDAGLPFIYSGKRMTGGPLNPVLRSIRDRLQTLVGSYYDSVLINYYPDGKSGMRFHSDPLYGVWDPDTAVVSLGDPRIMVFRDNLPDLGPPVKGVTRMEPKHYKYVVSHGTMVHMFGDCQDRFQHSIRTERTAEDAGPRVSLVFKREVRGSKPSVG
jgi:alkylated DNA repair dioxygenase AlkB